MRVTQVSHFYKQFRLKSICVSHTDVVGAKHAFANAAEKDKFSYNIKVTSAA